MQRILNRGRSSRIVTRNTVRRGHLPIGTNVLGNQLDKLLGQLISLGKRARQVIRAIGKRGVGRAVARDHPAQRGAQRTHKGARAAAAGHRLARGKRLGKPAAGLVHHLLAHTHAPSSHIHRSSGNRRPTASIT